MEQKSFIGLRHGFATVVVQPGTNLSTPCESVLKFVPQCIEVRRFAPELPWETPIGYMVVASYELAERDR